MSHKPIKSPPKYQCKDKKELDRLINTKERTAGLKLNNKNSYNTDPELDELIRRGILIKTEGDYGSCTISQYTRCALRAYSLALIKAGRIGESIDL